jgi:hypothetical protein
MATSRLPPSQLERLTKEKPPGGRTPAAETHLYGASAWLKAAVASNTCRASWRGACDLHTAERDGGVETLSEADALWLFVRDIP